MTVPTPSTAPPGAPGSPPAEPRYPWQLFVGMLAAIVLGGAVLALLLGLNPLTFQRLAPEGQPTPVVTVQTGGAAPTGVAPAGLTPVPTTAPTAESAPRATTGPAVVTLAPTTPATPQPTTGALVAPTTVRTETVPGAQVDPTPAVLSAVDANLANTVVDAYIRYWDVRAHATGDPFASGLDADLAGVMAGTELAKAQQSVADFRADGKVYLVHVDHQIQLKRATSQEALIVDQFTSTARRIDPDTSLPVESQPLIEHRTDAFLLRPIDGTWKVVDEPEP